MNSKKTTVALLAAAASTTVMGEVYMKEGFSAGWEDRFVKSTEWKSASEIGAWETTAGKYFADETDMAIQTSEDARFYGLSAKLDKEFDNKGKDLILQYEVKFEQKIDCGGAYIKLWGPDGEQSAFGGDTPYSIMFGPDVCGSTKRTHAIFNYPPKDDNLLIKNDVTLSVNQLPHLYTFYVKPDNTFEIYVDGDVVREGSLEENWDFLEPKEIKDPEESKPTDWVDAKKIPDPEDVKPEGYDDIPAQIPDPEAEMPDDWDEDEDGEWEPPMLDNPEYKGPWKPKMIDNPDYVGEWEHPLIANPDYVQDAELYYRCKPCTAIGFELWQVKSGTMFDNILVTDDFDVAKDAMDAFKVKYEATKVMFDEQEAEEKAKLEAERAAAAAAAEEEDDEDDEDDEEDDWDEDEEEHDEL